MAPALPLPASPGLWTQSVRDLSGTPGSQKKEKVSLNCLHYFEETAVTDTERANVTLLSLKAGGPRTEAVGVIK